MCLIGTSSNAEVVFLVKYIAEKDVVPFGVDSAQVIDALLSFAREALPSTRFEGVIFVQFV